MDETENEGAESTELENAEENPGIETLAALSDQELMELLGWDDKLKNIREAIAECQKLTGEARRIAEERIQDWFEPHVDEYSFKYLADDAKREAKRNAKGGEEAYADDSPASIV